MKLTLTGDHRRDISVEGMAAIQPNTSCWQTIMSSPALIEGLKDQVPSPLCYNLFPNLVGMKDVVLLTGFKNVDKSVYLCYLAHVLNKEYLKRRIGYHRGGPRAIIIVPTEKRVLSISRIFRQFKYDVRINHHPVNIGTVAPMLGENPSFAISDDIVIATPKAIGDFLDKNPKKVKILTFYLKHVVVDRADECCDISVQYHRKLKSCLSKFTKTWHPQILIIAQELTNSILELSSFMAETRKITLRCGFEVGYDNVEAAGGVFNEGTFVNEEVNEGTSVGLEQEDDAGGVFNEGTSVGLEQEDDAGGVVNEGTSVGLEQEDDAGGVFNEGTFVQEVNEGTSVGLEQEAAAGGVVNGTQSVAAAGVGRQREAAAGHESPRGERYKQEEAAGEVVNGRQSIGLEQEDDVGGVVNEGSSVGLEQEAAAGGVVNGSISVAAAGVGRQREAAAGHESQRGERYRHLGM